MDCAFYREAISARIDGELGALESAALDGHLTGCGACRSWAEAATWVTRAARVGPADAVPDLTESIMAKAAGTGPRAANVKAANVKAANVKAATHHAQAQAGAGSPVGIARVGLLMVALAQLCLAVPALLGDDGGAPIHVAHEQGSWFVALGVGLLVVASRPSRAAAMLPLVAALVVGLGTTMALDVWAGRTQAAAEAPHGLAFLGLGFLWVLAYPTALGRRRGGRPRPA
jgi:predicted anti-sigma-YlaC factor YlaD